MAAMGSRTLLVDADPQGNSTSGIGVEKQDGLATLYDILVGTKPATHSIHPTAYPNLAIIPSDRNLVGANLDLVDLEDREYRLKKALDAARENYDYIIIDCPPALDLLTINGLVAADSVLVPIQCEFFALEGISQLMDTVDRIKESFAHSLEIEGILLTMYDDRTNLARQVADDLKEFFNDQVFKTVIPRSIRLAEAPSYGKPIIDYDPRSRGAESYMELAKEIIRNEQRKRQQTQSAG